MKTQRRISQKNYFSGKEIGIGVTGSIAAYKSVEIVSYLAQQNARVTVVMTKSAIRFVTPLTFQTLSHNKVITDLFDEIGYVDPAHNLQLGQPKVEVMCGVNPQHIALAEKLDLLLIAPASANIIGKIAAGIADDALSTLVTSLKPSKVIIAPAMNERMYLNTIVQRNITTLKKLGYRFVEPEKGHLACGYGAGRLASPDKIIKYLGSVI
jgi:phosphopantothenoylcysteine decarboxylase/phosphopantothenate--cysteine ligase